MNLAALLNSTHGPKIPRGEGLYFYGKFVMVRDPHGSYEVVYIMTPEEWAFSKT